MSSLAWIQEITEDYFAEDIERKGFSVAEGTDRQRYRNPAELVEGRYGTWDDRARQDWELLPAVVELMWLHGDAAWKAEHREDEKPSS